MNSLAGLEEPAFVASFGFFLIAMAVLSFVFALGTLRLNICLMVVELGLIICFSLLTATFWQLAQGNAAVAGKCLTVCCIRSRSLIFGGSCANQSFPGCWRIWIRRFCWCMVDSCSTKPDIRSFPDQSSCWRDEHCVSSSEVGGQPGLRNWLIR